MPNRLLGIATWFLLQGIAFLSVGHAASATETLTIGYSSFSGHYVPLWIAVDDRLGKKYGLELKAVYAGRARPQQLLMSGETPLPSLAVIKSGLDILSLEYPQAKQTDPAPIIDPSIVRRIEQSGFIDALYKK